MNKFLVKNQRNKKYIIICSQENFYIIFMKNCHNKKFIKIIIDEKLYYEKKNKKTKEKL